MEKSLCTGAKSSRAFLMQLTLLIVYVDVTVGNALYSSFMVMMLIGHLTDVMASS